MEELPDRGVETAIVRLVEAWEFLQAVLVSLDMEKALTTRTLSLPLVFACIMVGQRSGRVIFSISGVIRRDGYKWGASPIQRQGRPGAVCHKVILLHRLHSFYCS